MNGLSELSGALPHAIPPQSPERSAQRPFPFPGNMAVGLVPNAPIPRVGGSEFAWHRECLWAAQPYRKPPQREGVGTEFLASARVLWETGNKQLEADIGELKTKYIFRNESAITQFILGHRATTGVLFNALPELKNSFGEDMVFHLEAVRDEDESTSLYAIVAWRGLVEGAESALEDFDERWWLNQSAQPGLTFTYELA
jgi:hypothetical protein